MNISLCDKVQRIKVKSRTLSTPAKLLLNPTALAVKWERDFLDPDPCKGMREAWEHGLSRSGSR